jgi:hypothetical protein
MKKSELKSIVKEALESLKLPQDLTKATVDQRVACIKYLAKKPLSDLRRRQQLCFDQQKKAYADKNTYALNNLDIMDKVLIAAISARGFRGSVE